MTPWGGSSPAFDPAGDEVGNGDRRIGALAQELGTAAHVARIQDRAAAQAVEAAQADLAAAKTCLASALARAERSLDGLAEARRLLLRRDATHARIAELVAQLVAACSEPNSLQAANIANDPIRVDC